MPGTLQLDRPAEAAVRAQQTDLRVITRSPRHQGEAPVGPARDRHRPMRHRPDRLVVDQQPRRIRILAARPHDIGRVGVGWCEPPWKTAHATQTAIRPIEHPDAARRIGR
jgi:hypothetical protein